MRFVHQAALLSALLYPLLTSGQESTKPTSHSSPPPLELTLKKEPMWKGTCLELRVQRTNLSKFSVFLDATYEGIKIYSSVSDATNTLGQGTGQAWMLVYGWTDVVSEPIELAPGARRQNTLCIAETFPVKEAGKETLRQVRLQGKLRIVAGHEIPTWRTICKSQGKGRRAYVQVVDKSNQWTFDEVALEVPIPCPNSIRTPDCAMPSQIFPGEHDVHAFELEPPPAIEIQLPRPPVLPIDHSSPAKPK
jgi:hypothetical protein